jgi:hypothetical protein
MKLKNLDLKKYFVEKGERIAVFAAGGLAGLFALSASCTALGSKSPLDVAKALTEPTAALERRLTDPNNVPGEADLPPSKEPPGLDFKLPTLAAGPAFRPFVPVGGKTALGRSVPEIYPPDDIAAGAKWAKFKSFILTPTAQGVPLVMVRGDKNDPNSREPATGTAAVRPKSQLGRLLAIYEPQAKLTPQQAYLKRIIESQPGLLDRIKAKASGGGGAFGPGGGKDDDIPKPRQMPIDKVTTEVPLDQVRPARYVEIAGSFPVKKQLQEFQAKIHLNSLEDVMDEEALNSTPEEPLYAFSFRGVNVERRELDLDGKPVPGKAGEFTPLDLGGAYREYLVVTGMRFETEDPSYLALNADFPGLVMPHLLQFNEEEMLKELREAHDANRSAPGRPGVPAAAPRPRPMERRGPGAPGAAAETLVRKDLYKIPELLPELQKSRESLATKQTEEQRDNLLKGVEGFNPFKTPFGSGTTATAAPGRGPGAGRPGALPGRRRGRHSGAPAPGTAPAATSTPDEQVIPEHCLVRVIDVTVQPGKTYEYRLQIIMANPNYGHKDVASVDYAKDTELVSPWTTKKIIVKVDDELRYYAMDQASDRGSQLKNGVMMQAHKWIKEIRRNDVPGPVYIGEWAIAERFLVYKGEYVGREERAQVPYWHYEKEKFVLANDYTGRRSKEGIDVNFGYDRPDRNPPEMLLVDFTQTRGGTDRTIRRGDERGETRRVTDDAAVEVLMLSPEGKLIAHNALEDSRDKERDDRVEANKARIADVRDAGGAASDPRKPKGPFGN